MKWPDLVNGGFEFMAGIGLWINVMTLYRDKEVRGVNIWSAVMFNLWGFWNLWYYPHLGQMVSMAGGFLNVMANTTWVVLAIKYSRR